MKKLTALFLVLILAFSFCSISAFAAEVTAPVDIVERGIVPVCPNSPSKDHVWSPWYTVGGTAEDPGFTVYRCLYCGETWHVVHS